MAEKEPEAKIGAKDDETIEKFNGTNWHEWKFRICALLQAKGLWHVISQPTPTQYEQESVTIPAITDKDGKVVKEAIQGFQDTSKVNDDWKEWVTSDIKARGQISMHMLSSMSVMLKNTTKETWLALLEHFDMPGAAGLFTEFQKVMAFKFPQGANPATEFNVLAKSFDRLQEKGFPIPEIMRVMFFLSALPPKWEGTAQNILFNMDVKNTTIHDVLPIISGEWERKQSSQGGVSHGAFAARVNLRTNNGKKPQWKAGAPHPYKKHQNASSGPSGQGQNQQGQWRQANYKKQHFKPQFQPASSDSRQQAGPRHPSKGPNWTRNVQNRSNKQLAAALREQEGGTSKHGANIPKFANMALIDRISPSGDTDCKKDTEKDNLMEIDLSSDNFPVLSKAHDKGKAREARAELTLGNHKIAELNDAIKTKLSIDNLVEHNQGYQDNFENETYHDWMHPNPMGDRRCETDSVLGSVLSPLGDSNKENMSICFDYEDAEAERENQYHKALWIAEEGDLATKQIKVAEYLSDLRKMRNEERAAKENEVAGFLQGLANANANEIKENNAKLEREYDEKHAKIKREEKRANEKREEKEREKKFLGNWYDDTIMTMGSYPHDDPKNDDAVSYGSWNDDFDLRYDSQFSLNKANDQILAKLKPSNSNICNSVPINVAYSVLKHENGSDDSYWLVDGGASIHCTPYISDFSKYKEYSTPDSLNTASGYSLDIKGTGEIWIQYDLNKQKREMMIEACYVPKCDDGYFQLVH